MHVSEYVLEIQTAQRNVVTIITIVFKHVMKTMKVIDMKMIYNALNCSLIKIFPRQKIKILNKEFQLFESGFLRRYCDKVDGPRVSNRD